MAATFDAKYPVAFTAVRRVGDSPSTHSYVLATHTLLEPALRVCATVPLREAIVNLLTSTATGTLLCISAKRTSAESRTVECTLQAVDVIHGSESAWGHSPICTSASLAPDGFTRSVQVARHAYYIRQTTVYFDFSCDGFCRVIEISWV